MCACISSSQTGKSPPCHPKLTALHETKSLDRSGIARRQLEHLLNSDPSSSGSASNQSAPIPKTVALRKPRPLLRKSQTVSLTGLGIGVDPDLMTLLASRKERSLSDDEGDGVQDSASNTANTSRRWVGLHTLFNGHF